MPFKKIAILCLLSLSISCGRRVVPSAELEALTGAAISLPNECATVGGGPKILFYVDAAGCTSCRLRTTMQWYSQNRQALAEMDSCTVVIILAPTTVEQFNAADAMCWMYDRPELLLWDSTQVFKSKNPVIPEVESYHTFLLDRDNRVVLVGSPVGNPRMWTLYTRTIGQLVRNGGKMPSALVE